MNLRAYYQKSKDIEAQLIEPFPILASHETPDGGKEGVLTEVPRHLAARMIADGRARLAEEADARVFRETNAEAKRQAEQDAAATRMQVTLVPTSELKAARNVRTPRE